MELVALVFLLCHSHYILRHRICRSACMVMHAPSRSLECSSLWCMLPSSSRLQCSHRLQGSHSHHQQLQSRRHSWCWAFHHIMHLRETSCDDQVVVSKRRHVLDILHSMWQKQTRQPCLLREQKHTHNWPICLGKEGYYICCEGRTQRKRAQSSKLNCHNHITEHLVG